MHFFLFNAKSVEFLNASVYLLQIQAYFSNCAAYFPGIWLVKSIWSKISWRIQRCFEVIITSEQGFRPFEVSLCLSSAIACIQWSTISPLYLSRLSCTGIMEFNSHPRLSLLSNRVVSKWSFSYLIAHTTYGGRNWWGVGNGERQPNVFSQIAGQMLSLNSKCIAAYCRLSRIQLCWILA